MKLHVLPLLCGILTATLSFAQKAIPNQYIVTLKDSHATPLLLFKNTDDPDRDRANAGYDGLRGQKTEQFGALCAAAGIAQTSIYATYADGFCGFAVKADERQIAQLAKLEAIENIVPDEYLNLEPSEFTVEDTQESSSAAQQASCAVTIAGGSAEGGAKSTVIWILDTGIDLDHPDLNVLTGANYVKSFITGQAAEDGNGHGTHVAGIAAAKNNDFGIVGISAGAKLAAIKILDNAGNGSLGALLSGLDHVAKYCSANDVINISIGAYPVLLCDQSSTSLKKLLTNLNKAKVWVCIASGNNGCDAAKSRPGCFNGTRTLTVGSVNCDLSCSTFSNWNKTVVDWVASGANIYSTYKNGGYAKLSGTSMAAPVVAGICHARAAAPVAGNSVNCKNNCVPTAPYKIAKRQ